jgi:hypothetical protein
LQKLPANRPDIQSLFESMTPYFDSGIPPTDELIRLKMIEGYKDGSKRRTTKSATTAKKSPPFVSKLASKTCRTFRGFLKSNSAMRRRENETGIISEAKNYIPQKTIVDFFSIFAP